MYVTPPRIATCMEGSQQQHGDIRQLSKGGTQETSIRGVVEYCVQARGSVCMPFVLCARPQADNKPLQALLLCVMLRNDMSLSRRRWRPSHSVRTVLCTYYRATPTSATSVHTSLPPPAVGNHGVPRSHVSRARCPVHGPCRTQRQRRHDGTVDPL